MARVFISYSRKNIEFTRQIAKEFEKHNLDYWVDWEGIPPTVDWMKEIQRGIEDADVFLFIISPDSIKSKVCREELDLAIKNGKRLIPIVPFEIQWGDVPQELSHLNYIFFRESDDFDTASNKLLTAINTDYEWTQVHRRLQVKALEWERSDREQGFLLRGKDLENAEEQISINATKDPHPTDIQRDYVLKSRQATDRQRRITTGSLITATFVMFAISAYLAVPRILDKIAQLRARGEMVVIQAGPAIFGTEDSFYIDILGFPPRQEIDILPSFQINKYEVSNYQYGLCVKYGDCTAPIDQTVFNNSDKSNYPVVNVTLFQSNTYCQWLGQRLPNQFEWERVARGYQGFDWPWGNDQEPTPETANMPWKEYSPTDLQPIDSNPAGASPEGILNLIGNASEWTSSLSLEGVIEYDQMQFWDGKPEHFNGDSTYVQKGGGWRINVDEVGTFNPDRGTSARDDLGFRCAADVN